jgi:methyl-accepting chemotaxis protein
MRNLSIGAKLGGLAASLLLLVVISLLFVTHRLGAASDVIDRQAHMLERLQAVNDLGRDTLTLKYWLVDLAVSLQVDSENAAKETQTAIERRLAQLESTDRQAARDLRAMVTQYVDSMMAGVDAYTEDNRVLGNSLIAQARPFSNEMEKRMSELLLVSAQGAAAAGREVIETNRSTRRLALFLIPVAILIGLIIARLIARSLTGPVRETMRVLEALAEGDLGPRLDATSREELGRMAAALNGAMDGLAETIMAIDRDVRVLTKSSEDLQGVSQGMSDSSGDASAQAAAVSSASDRISESVRVVAKSLEEMTSCVAEIAKQTSQAAVIANSAVDYAETITETMKQLGTSSHEIGSVVQVIAKIAEQTNLLALNATIEAARAGESGKGFSVVASEVKELAKGTAQATKEIGAMVGRIRGETERAVNATSQVRNIIGQVKDIATTIASAVEEQAAATREIGRNMHDAAQGTQDIGSSIAQMASASRGAATGAGQTQKAAAELSRMAVGLNDRVARFKNVTRSL